MLFRKNVIEKNFINCRVVPLVKINTRISNTPVYVFIEMETKIPGRRISRYEKALSNFACLHHHLDSKSFQLFHYSSNDGEL
jgi:hypothetical protein